MPRKKREQSPTGIYHWIVRGMNKKRIFHQVGDYQQFRKLLAEYKAIFEIKIYHYCFMTNHVHLLVWAHELQQLSQFSHYVQRRYAYYYCGKYQWSGSVFQRGYRSMAVDRDEYLLECGRYIERNPIKAKLVKTPAGYEHTSYHYYAQGKIDDLLTPSPVYFGLSDHEQERRKIYSEYVSQRRVQEEMIEKGLLKV